MSTQPLHALLQHPAFVRFWWARITGVTANQMLMVAVAWHMYDITGRAWDLGMVGLLQFLPALLLTLPAGHAADRWHRSRLFAICMLSQTGLALLLLAAIRGQFATRELMWLVAVGLGCVRAFQMPAQQALTPLLVPPSLLQRAVALSSSGMQLAIIAGPALGGILYTYGASTVYASCAALLLVAALLALSVRYHHQRASGAATWQTVLAGIHFVWQHKLLLGATSLDLFAVLLGGATALLPIFARDILQTGPVGLGLLRSAPALGSLFMSLILMQWPLRRHVGPKLLYAVAAYGVVTVAFALSHSFVWSIIWLALSGAADSVSVVTRLTLMQSETPDELRGRVSAVNSIFIGASNQLGEFESGATAAWWGPVGSVVVGGLGSVLIALLWWRIFPALARRDRMT